jgi:hypothetical protein
MGCRALGPHASQKVIASLYVEPLKPFAVSLVIAGCLASAAPSHAAPPKGQSVVGGTIAAATEAPWAVWVVSVDPSSGEIGYCSGSIIAPNEVLTAAHCAGQPASEYRVWAGWRPGPDGRAPSDAFDQSRAVSSIRTHPDYVPNPSGALDDVSVLRLSAPFDVSGPRVAPITLSAAPPAAGTPLRFYGYGSPRIGEFRGFAAALLPRWRCGGSAVWLCGNSTDGAACGGDSGGGMVALTTPPQLIAVVSVGGLTCQVGGPNGYADITAPEIARWIAGEARPPVGPRLAGAVPPLAALPDGSVRCDSAAWTGTPNLKFTFSDAMTGALLQDGSAAAYRPTPANAGRAIRCVITASNAGGFAESSPEALVVPSAWGVLIEAGKVTTRVWSPSDGRVVALSFINARGQVVQRVAVERREQLPMSLPALPVGTYAVCLEVTAGGPFTAWRECAATTVNAEATTLLRRGKVKRKGARYDVTLKASGPAVGRRVTVTWLAARCKACKATRLGKWTALSLRASRTIRSPKVPRGRRLRLQVKLPTLSADGGSYVAGSKTFTVR